MSSEKYIGLDVHQATISVAVLDSRGKLVMESIVETKAATRGKPQPAGFKALSAHEGGTAMGFYNVLQGDAPYFKSLADNYAMSDNFHQSVMGGTGANHVMLGAGDAIWFSDGHGNPLAPPENVLVAPGSPNAGIVSEIENPNPQPGTNNWNTEDGY